MNCIPLTRGKRAAAFISGALVTAFVAVSIAGCSQAPAADPADPAEGGPAVVAEVPGTDLHRLTLTERAVERVGIRTAVTATVPQTKKLTVPYAAIIYDSTGKTWVYTNPEPRVYMRQSITVERITGDMAVLTAGPPAGTVVVTTGAEELFGAEFDTAH